MFNRVHVDDVVSGLFASMARPRPGAAYILCDDEPAPADVVMEGAARRLGVDPARCVVLEDSPAGVASGEAAGCAVVAVPSVVGVGFTAGPRRLVVPSLTEVSASTLSSLVGSGHR